MPFVTAVYEIRSLIETQPVVGITPPLSALGGPGPVILSEPVRINGSGIVWPFLLPMQIPGSSLRR